MNNKQWMAGLAAIVLMLLLGAAVAVAAADPKEMIEEIFTTKETLERSVRGGHWARADATVDTLVQQMDALVAALNLPEGEKYTRRTRLVAQGMRKAIAEKEDEEYEEPAHAMMRLTMQLMEHAGYPTAPVFIIMKRQVDEALELVEEKDYEAIEEELEEIVNLRQAARAAVKGSPTELEKVNVILDLAWDVARDADGRNVVSAEKRLIRMKKILETL